MSDKIETARRSISLIEDKAASIMEEVKQMVETDPRMRTDEAFRNSLISGKLGEVQMLQEQSLYHQSEIRKYQMQSTERSFAGSTTRSRASIITDSSSKITSVAANIQRMSRSQAIPVPSLSTKVRPIVEEAISEADQSKSITALLGCRNWLISREKELVTLLASEGLRNSHVSNFDRDMFSTVRSLRVRTEQICADMEAKQRPDPALVDVLRNIIHYVASLDHIVQK